MKNLFIIGGWSNKSISSCCVYNIISNTWSQIPDLNEARERAACAVFEGRIVVTGGYDLKSVEQYDYYENKWKYLPNMIEERSDHAAVSMGNKLFVIGSHETSNCEIFDSRSRKFASIKSFVKLPEIDDYYFKAVCVGYYIFVIHGFFGFNETKNYIYDVDKQMWSNFDSEVCENNFFSNCVKYYAQ